MIIMIDNYDSFTYHLYQYIGTINPDIEVYRNDKITVEEVLEKKPSHIILSPGTGFPIDAGICAVSYTHLDVYKRQAFDTYDKCNDYTDYNE